MNYGHFDELNKEYVITRPDTPSAWANYLGDPEYGAIISNNAGGYSFVKSGANGRVIRYRFNGVGTDTPGRYVYLRDLETNDYWSASWAPVCKPLDQFKSECRHGTAYTVITSEYKGVKSEVTYYVPQGATYEVWAARVTNPSDKPRKLAVTGVCEFVNDPNYEQDQVNLQYTLFITRTYFKGNYIHQMQNEIYNPNSGRFLGLAGAKVDAYCGDRDSFVGTYRSYSNPKGIEEGLKGDEFFMNMVEDRNLALGDTPKFHIERECLFAVADIAEGTQGVRRQRLEAGTDITVNTQLHAIKIYEELNRVLAGRIDFNKFVDIVSKSFTKDELDSAYAAFVGMFSKLNAPYIETGSFDEDKLLDLIEHVEASTGETAVIVGTRKALRQIKTAVVSDSAKEDM